MNDIVFKYSVSILKIIKRHIEKERGVTMLAQLTLLRPYRNAYFSVYTY